MTRRTLQVGELLKEELTDIIRKEVDDPRLGFWSIIRIDVSTDLRVARVYVSVLGSDDSRKETLAALRSASSFIRRHLKPRLRMRQIPELEFVDDRSLEHAETIARALRSLKSDEATPSPASDEH